MISGLLIFKWGQRGARSREIGRAHDRSSSVGSDRLFCQSKSRTLRSGTSSAFRQVKFCVYCTVNDSLSEEGLSYFARPRQEHVDQSSRVEDENTIKGILRKEDVLSNGLEAKSGSNKSRRWKWIVHDNLGDDELGMRLHRWFSLRYKHVPHSHFQKLLREKKVQVCSSGEKDGKWTCANAQLYTSRGMSIRVRLLSSDYENVNAPAKTSFDQRVIKQVHSWVIYMDASIIVVNKPPGLAVQGGTGVKKSFNDFLPILRYDSDENPRLVHRLDRDVGGIMVLARTRRSAQILSKEFSTRQLRKLYWAVCLGVPKRLTGQIKVKLLECQEIDEKPGKVRVVGLPSSEGRSDLHSDVSSPQSSKNSVTRYHTLMHVHTLVSVLALQPLTGRKHQLRVHCSQVLNCPIYGDYKYGIGCPENMLEFFNRSDCQDIQLHLHSKEIAFRHPETRTAVHFVAPLPEYMSSTLKELGINHSALERNPHAQLSRSERNCEPYEFVFRENSLTKKRRTKKIKETRLQQKNQDKKLSKKPAKIRSKVDYKKRTTTPRSSGKRKLN
ncbi:ribosomal large subunit pseudouridine synthase C-like [Schistocerca gregaria]|uniref:ribosomal large subunit pseudouridine synthase C-like n=1 Tax=Schistocerca gregaria TaxID=7010 RepID=UPI00211DEF07|nr:ribosomal large subunit pseudouridine synthase C-like [Schistocerca gregaria]